MLSKMMISLTERAPSSRRVALSAMTLSMMMTASAGYKFLQISNYQEGYNCVGEANLDDVVAVPVGVCIEEYNEDNDVWYSFKLDCDTPGKLYSWNSASANKFNCQGAAELTQTATLDTCSDDSLVEDGETTNDDNLIKLQLTATPDVTRYFVPDECHVERNDVNDQLESSKFTLTGGDLTYSKYITSDCTGTPYSTITKPAAELPFDDGENTVSVTTWQNENTCSSGGSGDPDPSGNYASQPSVGLVALATVFANWLAMSRS